jgi:LCP family protein required for cell wall assembly
MSDELDITQPEPKKKKMKTWKKVLLIVLAVLLLIGAVTGGGAALYVNHLLGKINYVDKDDSLLSHDEVEQLENENSDYVSYDENEDGTLPDIEELEQELMKDPNASAEPMPEAGSDENVINILLIGQDRRGEKRARSDSMILVTFNKIKGSITFTSFMRDSYVQIPGYKPNKLNHAFQYGGMMLLNETLWVNFGVRVDGNLEVDFDRFMGLIDLLGGVDIELTKKEVKYMTNNGSKWPELTPGMNHLTGEQALLYSRIRYIDSDYRRTERQRTVLMSLLDEYKSKSWAEMIVLLEDILPLVSTNLDKSEIWYLSRELFPMVAGAEINSQQIPAHGTFKGGNVRVRDGLKGWFQYNIDFQKNREILRDTMDAD